MDSSFLESHQLKNLTPPTVEGYAQRARVECEDGTSGLLYLFGNEMAFERVSVIASESWAGQLFAVPDRLNVWPEQLTILLQDLDGQTIPQHLASMGLDHFEQWSLAPSIMEQIGTLLRKLHSLGAPEHCFGDILEDGPQRRTFNGYVASRLEVFQEALHSSFDALDEEQRHQLLASLGDLRHELSAFHPKYPASITHGAVSLSHVWVDDRGEVIGLTGFDHASFLPPEMDLATFLWINQTAFDDNLIRTFYRGYGAARTMDMQRRERFYRRLSAFEALLGYRAGHASSSLESLLWMTTSAVARPPDVS